MIFYGWGKKRKVLRMISAQQCNTCNEESEHALVKVYSYVSIMFIPFIQFGAKYYIICTRCENGIEIPKQEAKAILAGSYQYN